MEEMEEMEEMDERGENFACHRRRQENIPWLRPRGRPEKRAHSLQYVCHYVRAVALSGRALQHGVLSLALKSSSVTQVHARRQ